MTTSNRLLGTNPVATGGAGAEAVSFDGTNDSLSRSSDLTGNADGKTFTFSGWVYQTGGNKNIRMINLLDSGTSNFDVYANDGYLYITGWNTAHSTQVIEARLDLRVPIKTWSHVLISADMTSTSNRYVYVDDIDYSSTINWYSYSNADINFTNNNPVVGSTYASADYSKGRLAHLFLDYTYRDLSITANRRLFIDSDGKPAGGQSALSPILYLPMKNADTAGSNSGTGGDFTVNGILATAERGPNQDNCSASKGSSTTDSLTNASFSYSDTTTMTFSANVFWPTSGGSQPIIRQPSGGYWYVELYSGNQLLIGFIGTAGISWYLEGIPVLRDKQFHVDIVYDGNSQANCKVLIDNVDVTSTSGYTQFNAGRSVNMSSYSLAEVNAVNGCNIGEVWMDNTYMDLSTENPFWDSDANRPNSVRKVIADTGVTPLIALPMIGSDAGNNLGTGGDFTVNSGPFTGARGGSEFWARTARVDGSSNGHISKTSALTGNTNSQQITIAFAIRATALNQDDGVWGFGSYRHYLYNSVSGNGLGWTVRNSNGANILSTTSYSISPYGTGGFDVYLMSCNIGSSTAMVYKNGVSTGSFTFPSSDSAGTTPDHANEGFVIGGLEVGGGGDMTNADYGGFYYDDSFIDFSQESNRNKFVDQLGYFRDLTQQIEDGDISTPLIYMKFEDATALGTNSGTGGDFNSVGSGVTSGSDFTP